jgi:hypothetical protein
VKTAIGIAFHAPARITTISAVKPTSAASVAGFAPKPSGEHSGVVPCEAHARVGDKTAEGP